MARWAPAKKDVLEALAAEILHNYGTGRAIVAVDGDSTTASGPFADDLAAAVQLTGHRVFRASIDNFHKPRIERESAPLPPAEAYYEHAFDYSLFRRVLVEPFRASGSTGFVLAGFDEQKDAVIQSKWATAGATAMLIVDGPFLNRPELMGLWNYSVWIESRVAEGDVADADLADGDVAEGDVPDGPLAGAEALYLASANPRGHAMAIIDNADREHPLRRFADSC